MTKKLLKLFMLLGCTGFFVQSGTLQAAEMACDRSCLISILQDYVDAVIANQPREAHLAGNYRGTENTFEIRPGSGLWQSATAMGEMQHYFGDPVNQSAAFYGLLNEGANPAIVSVRLKIDEQQVSEAEWVIARAGESLVNFEGVVANQPVKQTLPRSEWTSREDMIFAANAYFDALAEADRKPDYYVPSVAGCPRIENGTMVTGGGPVRAGEEAVEFDRGDCTSGLERMTQINGVNYRIFPVVDQEAGVVMGRGVFSRPPGAARRDGSLWPRNYLMEYFSIEDGEVTGIYAAMNYMPDDLEGVPF